MNYIWELFLQGGYENVHIRQDKIVSPYYEMNPYVPVENNEIGMNVMYRYSAIFMPLLVEECVSKELEEWFVDVLVHFLVSLDVRAGMTVNEYKQRWNVLRMKNGQFGEEVLRCSGKLKQDILYEISRFYTKTERTGATMSLFSLALINTMKTGILYQDKDDRDMFYYYVGRRENSIDKAIIDMVVHMLLPFGKEVRVFWNNHFGICGENSTMMESELELI